MKHQVVLLLIFATALAPARLVAQDRLVRATVDSGTLIRMHPETGPYLRGRLIQPLTPTSTVVHICRFPAPPCSITSDSAAFQEIPTSSLARIDVQEGTNSAKGAVIGGFAGGFLGAIAGAIGAGFCEESSGCGVSVVGYGLIGAMAGGGFGALVGSASPRWRPAL